jgi:hypothetical protein
LKCSSVSGSAEAVSRRVQNPSSPIVFHMRFAYCTLRELAAA